MRAVVQRVREASVTVDGSVIGAIRTGLMVLLGVAIDDTPAIAQAMADKIALLRIFPDADGKTNLSTGEIGGAVLLVSQFTLLADTRRGRRPSFIRAAPPLQAEPLIEQVAEQMRRMHQLPVENGRFGADMLVHLVNDGPFTIVLDSSDQERTRRGAP
ncbi:MAG: D-aminoacyl-tRNA deacylase [Herpetosiphon sp.]